MEDSKNSHTPIHYIKIKLPDNFEEVRKHLGLLVYHPLSPRRIRGKIVESSDIATAVAKDLLDNRWALIPSEFDTHGNPLWGVKVITLPKFTGCKIKKENK